jgi:hypothetical protein
MRRYAIIALCAALLPLWADAGARAQTPSCTVEDAGQVACIAGRLCSCGFARGSPATGLPDGFRWDCGILRPSCGPPVPATLDPWQGDLPDSLAIDRSNTIIREGTVEPRSWPRR